MPSLPADRDDEAPGAAAAEDVASRLRAERNAVVAALEARTRALEGVFDAAADSNSDDEHDPEGQTIAYERSQLAAAVRAAETQLADIDEALRRLEQGGYGICEVCGRPIPAARMSARPTATTCVEHADARPSGTAPNRTS
jgi:RNA polymerase-binding transcription factor DksA